MKAKSIKGKSSEEIQEALMQSTVDGFRPTLAIVFLSIKQNQMAIRDVFSKENIAIFGVTTGGEFIDEEIGEGSVAVLLLEIDPAHFFIQFAELDGTTDRLIAQRMGKTALQRFDSPTFLLAASNMETEPEKLLRGLEDAAGMDVNVYGAMAGDDFTLSDQFVFTNQQSSNRGCVTLAFNEEKIIVKGVVTCGWEPLGTEKTITKSEGQWIYTIDGKPALDVVKRFIGLADVKKEDRQSLVVEAAINCPMQLQLEKGEPIMRGVFMADWDKRAIMCSGSMPEGSTFRFSLPPDLSIIDKAIKASEDLKNDQMPEADALIMISCLGRFVSFGPLMTKEIEGIKNVWNVPMAGIFSNAELARTPGGNLEHHGSTTVCVALKERNK